VRPPPSRWRSSRTYPLSWSTDAHASVGSWLRLLLRSLQASLRRSAARAGNDSAGLGWQELPPCLGGASRRGLDPGLLQDRPDGAGRDPDTEPGEFALNPPGSPNLGSRGPAARSAHGLPRPLLACPACGADTSTVVRSATGASGGSSPAARTHRPTASPSRCLNSQ
jgi:hypothetical protein